MHTHHYRPIKGASVAFLGFSVAVGIALTLFQYVVLPQWKSMSAIDVQLKERKTALADTKAFVALEKRLAVLQDSLKRNYAGFSNELGEAKDLSAILRILIEKANAAGIQFVKMQPTSENPPGKTGAYPIVLEMTAAYNSLGRLIAELEAVPNLAHVDRMAISAAQNALLSVRIQVTCYLQ